MCIKISTFLTSLRLFRFREATTGVPRAREEHDAGRSGLAEDGCVGPQTIMTFKATVFGGEETGARNNFSSVI